MYKFFDNILDLKYFRVIDGKAKSVLYWLNCFHTSVYEYGLSVHSFNEIILNFHSQSTLSQHCLYSVKLFLIPFTFNYIEPVHSCTIFYSASWLTHVHLMFANSTSGISLYWWGCREDVCSSQLWDEWKRLGGWQNNSLFTAPRAKLAFSVLHKYRSKVVMKNIYFLNSKTTII